MDMAIETIDQWIAKRQNHYICCTDVHGIVRSQSDRRLREIQDKAGLVTPDGIRLAESMVRTLCRRFARIQLQEGIGTSSMEGIRRCPASSPIG
jgi:UDP-N-acetyl-D-mannosaminuronic acid transferase (WecB/TagA/CpsF family)